MMRFLTLGSVVLVMVGGLISSVALGSGGSELRHGDVDCDGSITTRDNQGLLRSVLQQNPLGQTEPCPDVGSVMALAATPSPIPSVGLARSNPAPAGQAYGVPEGWQLTILDFTANATQQVLDENQFNDPPAPGRRFSIVRLKTRNVSAGNPADHDVTFALRMVGSENVGYSTFSQSCGVVPDDFDFKPDDIFEGGELTGNICYETAIGETNFTIYTEYLRSDDEDVRWLEVE